MSTSISKEELLKKLGEKNSPSSSTNEESSAAVENSSEVRKYQFPSAPCSFHFPWEADKRAVHDGVYQTSDPREIAYLEDMVKVFNISHYFEPSQLVQHQIPTPTTKLIDNPGR